MADLTPQERLAALQARRSAKTTVHFEQTARIPEVASPPPAAPSPTVTAQLPRSDAPALPAWWSWSRVAATGTSVVSFASMMVAMGPLLKTVEQTAADGTAATDTTQAAGQANPATPAVDISVAPGAATPGEAVEPLVVTPATAAPATVDQANTPADPPPTAPPAIAPQGTAAPVTAQPVPPPSTAPPATAPPATAPPETVPPATAPPSTAPPATAPPATAPPETAPPVTAPPQTAPPVTAAPPPPRSEPSGE